MHLDSYLLFDIIITTIIFNPIYCDNLFVSSYIFVIL